MSHAVVSKKRNSNVKVADSPAAFLSLLKDGITHLTDAARMLKRLVEKNEDAIDEIIELEPTLSRSVLQKLLRVAEGSLVPELLLNSAPAFKHLQSLPIAVQKEAVKQGAVDVVVDADRGEHRRVPLAEVELRHIPQVFDRGGIRNVEAQREFLKSRPRRPGPIAVVEAPWIIRGGKCIVRRDCLLNPKDLLQILEGVAPSAETPWTIKDGRCFFTRPCSLTKDDLLKIASAIR